MISVSSFANQIGFCQIGADGATKSLVKSIQKPGENSVFFEGEISHFKVKVMQVGLPKIPITITDDRTNLTYVTEMAMTGNKTVFVISKEAQEMGINESLAPQDGLTVYCQAE